MLMIRLFLTLCKYFQINKNDDDYLAFQLYSQHILMDNFPCAYPGCPSTGSYTGAGSYTRSLICYTGGKVERHTIRVERVECASCGHTHALLPPVVIPYSPFSLHFVISLLYDFITHKYGTAESLCLHYDISVSTLYRIWHRLLEDKKLMLGLMEGSIASAEAFLCGFLSGSMAVTDPKLDAYFGATGTSFLQARRTIRPTGKPGDAGPDAPT